MSESKPADDASLWLQGTVKTGVDQVLRDKSGRNLLTNPAAVGVKAAWAQYRLRYGTWEPCFGWKGKWQMADTM